MHLCIICHEYPPAPHGGIGAFSQDLARGMARCGHKVTVLGIAIRLPNRRREDAVIDGVRVVRLPRAAMWWPSRLRDWWHRWQLRRALVGLHRATPIDVVECPDYQGWLSGGALSGVPLVVRIHGSNLFFDTLLERPGNPTEHRHERECFARATHLAAVSKFAGETTLQLAGSPHREFELIYNSIDTAFFCPSSSARPQPGLILYVNSLNPKKGIEQLIDAANDLLPRRPEAHVAIIGGDNMRALKGHYLEQLKRRVGDGIRERVTFLGRLPREQVRDWMRKAAVCIFPSHMETFGIAPAEAMAVGRPVIYSSTGPGPELISPGANGLLCDPRNPTDIAAKIEQVLADPEASERMGAAARVSISALANETDWLKRNERFYERCIADAKNARGA